MLRITIQFTVFAAVGALGTAVHFGVMIVLVQLHLCDPMPASAAGFVAGALVNYLLNHRITFQSGKSHLSAAPRFFAVAVAGLFLNLVVMHLASSRLHYLLAQAIATALVLLWNFLCNRIWTFGGEAPLKVDPTLER